jgi:hypothetical protein
MLDVVLRQNQIRIEEERFALRRDGSMLFGVLQLAYGETADGRAALGLRTANNKTTRSASSTVLPSPKLLP